MKALLIVAGLFFAIFGGIAAYFAASDPGHEYDLKFVLPIDARQMPKPFEAPAVRSLTPDELEAAPMADGRAEAGASPPIPNRPPVQFEEMPGAASETVKR